ncbi:M23 family metallopeptidase [Sphingomonas canadensis]|nr:M23 family metallopeptidase [Sphingomonas canadensis]
MFSMLAFFAAMAHLTAPHGAGGPHAMTQPHGAAAPGGEAADHPPLLIPVAGVGRGALVDSWGASRHGGLRRHQGTDIMAPEGTAVLAAAAGTVEKLFFSNGGGGITLYVRSPDRRWSYYYAHLKGYAPGIAEGVQVKAGQVIAFVGDTGNAAKGSFHLHFGLSRMAPGEGWWQGEAVNAYPLLAGTGGGG